MCDAGDGVIELDRRLPRPLECRPRRVQLAELALRHPDRPHGDGPLVRCRVGGEHRGAVLDRLQRVALHTDEELLGVVEHVGHLARHYSAGVPRLVRHQWAAMSSWVDGATWDFDGPVGAYERAFARRRIAVGADEAGRPFLLRPNSVVFDLQKDSPRRSATRGPSTACVPSSTTGWS